MSLSRGHAAGGGPAEAGVVTTSDVDGVRPALLWCTKWWWLLTTVAAAHAGLAASILVAYAAAAPAPVPPSRLAPELLQGEKATQASDVYAFGEGLGGREGVLG